MAEFFHASRRTAHKGAAVRTSDYNARRGCLRQQQVTDLVSTYACNVPEGIEPRDFWRAVDAHSRKNGVAFRSWNIALPRALSRQENTEVMKDLVNRLANGRVAEAALHSPLAALEGGEQPHVHVMIYNGVPDGIDRPLHKMVARYNPKNPAAGGCRKEGAATRRVFAEQLTNERKLCAEVLNRHLEKKGISLHVDHRSNVERGLPPPRRAHLGASGVAKLRANCAKPD